MTNYVVFAGRVASVVYDDTHQYCRDARILREI